MGTGKPAVSVAQNCSDSPKADASAGTSRMEHGVRPSTVIVMLDVVDDGSCSANTGVVLTADGGIRPEYRVNERCAASEHYDRAHSAGRLPLSDQRPRSDCADTVRQTYRAHRGSILRLQVTRARLSRSVETGRCPV